MDSLLANTIKTSETAGQVTPQPIVPTVNFQNGTAPAPAPVATAPQPMAGQTSIPSGLDPQIVNLAKALRQTESQGNFQAVGKSGEYGAYQFLPSTWDATAPKYGVNVPLTQATPEQQNEVAYKQLAEWKAQHPEWNVGNFASAWNAGPGKPNAYLENNVGTNAEGVAYDTPAYALKVAQNYQQFKAQTPNAPVLDGSSPTASDTSPSIGGFAQNVLKSGLGLLGNVGEAVLHPIQTVQNIGGAAVGGLEKGAGETTDNTAKFDGVVNFFKDRYGSLDQFEKTLYTDPVGVAADLSTVLGGAGLAVKGAGLAAKVGKAGEIAGALDTAGGALATASDLTNPLTPIATGIGKAITPAKNAIITGIGGAAKLEGNTIDLARTGDLTPELIANTTRESVGSEVASVLKERLNALEQSGKEYNAIRELQQSGRSFSSDTLIPVAHNFMEEQLRTQAGLDVRDGRIVSSAGSAIRGSELSKLQQTFDLYKPAFQKGVLTPNEFLNFRSDMSNIAYNDLGKKNSDVARITDNIRHNFNEQYRGEIPGLKELDLKFAKETKELTELKKGLFDRNGKLTDTAFNLVANATNKGNEARLARLEKLSPGITEKIKILKAVEDMQRALTKTGTYTTSILESGTVLAGVSTGHLGVAATGFAAMIISRPENAVKIISAVNKIDPRLATAVMARVARYATITGEANRSVNESGTSQTVEQPPQPGEQSTPPLPVSDGVSSPEAVPQQ